MKEQIKGFNEAYKKVKKLGFQNYFCLHDTTWKEADNNFKAELVLQDNTSIEILKEAVNIVLNSGKSIPICQSCGRLFSVQEKKAGFDKCEHCEVKA